jgi:hypothetical protein
MQFGVSEMEIDPLIVRHGTEERVGDCRALGFDPREILFEFGFGFFERNRVLPYRSFTQAWNSASRAHGLIEYSILHWAHEEFGDEGNFEGDAVEAVVDPGGEMIEVLGGGPVAEAAELAFAVGFEELFGVGEGFVDGFEMELPTVLHLSRLNRGCSGHVYLS